MFCTRNNLKSLPWESSTDTLGEVILRFSTKEKAIEYAKKNDISYKIIEPKKNNIVSFPSNINEGDREVEAIIFAASEPLDIDTIESKISKKIELIVDQAINSLDSFLKNKMNGYFDFIFIDHAKKRYLIILNILF